MKLNIKNGIRQGYVLPSILFNLREAIYDKKVRWNGNGSNENTIADIQHETTITKNKYYILEKVNWTVSKDNILGIYIYNQKKKLKKD